MIIDKSYVKEINRLEIYELARLLTTNPELIVHIKNTRLNKLTGYDWRMLLIKQPQLHRYCHWNKLSRFEWSELLLIHPQFYKFYDKEREYKLK